jgi:hypothetical protein
MTDFRDFKLNKKLSDIASEKLSGSDGGSTNGDLTPTETTGEASPIDEYKKMRDKIIADEEKDVKKARTLVVVALCTCIIAVSSAIYVFAANGDKFSFELEVSHRYSLAPHSPDIHSNLISSLIVVRIICSRHYCFGSMGSPVQLCSGTPVQCCHDLHGPFNWTSLSLRDSSSL